MVKAGDKFQFVPYHLAGTQELVMPGGLRTGVVRTGTVIHVNSEHCHFTVEYPTGGGGTLRKSFKFERRDRHGQ